MSKHQLLAPLHTFVLLPKVQGSRRGQNILFTCLFPVVAYSQTTFRNAWLFALGEEGKGETLETNSVYQSQELRRKSVLRTRRGERKLQWSKFSTHTLKLWAQALNPSMSPHILALTQFLMPKAQTRTHLALTTILQSRLWSYSPFYKLRLSLRGSSKRHSELIRRALKNC